MTVSALTTLRTAGPGLSPALRRIAEYALGAPERVLYQTVMEVAEAAGSSEASVIRFCRDVGYPGFQAFKLALAFELAVQPTEPLPQGAPQSAADEVAQVLRQARTALDDTASLLDPAALERVVGALGGAGTVDCYGVGASGVTAQDFAYKFMRLGLVARAYPDPHLAAMSAATLGPGAVALGISRSGTTLDVVRALTHAREAGAFTVALTGRHSTPLAAAAHETLIAPVHEHPLSGGSISAKLGQLVVLDLLYTLLARRPAAEEAVRRTAAAVADRNV